MAVAEIDQSESELRSAVEVFPELGEVVADIDAADAAAEDIERRIVAGDDGVGLADLEEAEKGSRLARLKARRAVRKAEEAAEARRLARIDELREEMRAAFPDLQHDVLTALDGAVEATAKLAGAIGSHNERLHAVVEELVELGPLPQDLASRSGLTSGSSMLRVGDLQIDAIPIGQWMSLVAWRALTEAGDTAAAGKIQRAAGISHDRHTATVYGVPDAESGAVGAVTPDIVLRAKAGQLRKGGRS